MANPFKRQRCTPTWSIFIDDPGPLTAVVNAVAAVMSRVSFRVMREGEHIYLAVDSADVAFMCCVSARLRLDKVSFPSGEEEASEFRFCVDCKHVCHILDNPSCSQLSVLLEGYQVDVGTPHVLLKLHDPESHAHEVEAALDIFENDESHIPERLDYRLGLELDLAQLKEIIKTANKAHTEHMQVRIYLQDVGAKKLSVVVFSLDGQFRFSQKFCHEVIKDEDGSLRVRAAADGVEKLVDIDTLAPVFQGTFPIDKIHNFVKQLPCRMLAAKVENGVPMMLHYPLGGASDDSSHIRFLVAPIVDGED